MVPLVALAFAFLQASTPSEPATVERPNIVLVMTDDQGFGDFGFTGNPVIVTPHLDALSEASTRVEPFYVRPVCTPTRAALMTGRHPERTRAIDTWIGRAMMDPDEVTLAEHLRAAGYRTGIFGKWHLGDCAPMRPEDQGFDEVLVHRGGGIGQPADPIGAEGRYTNPVLRTRDGESEYEGYCTDIYFDHALDFARRQHASGRSFFAYVATNAPHSPFHDVPEDWLERYRETDLTSVAPADANDQALDRLARTYAMISNIDENVGRLIAGLGEMGALEKTLFVFLSDNGPDSTRFRGLDGGAPLRGTKTTVFEGGVRSPLLLAWPGVLEEGRVALGPAQDIDLVPTLLRACGVNALEGAPAIDGVDLWPALSTNDVAIPSERLLFAQAHRGDRRLSGHNFFVRRGRWKLVRPTGFRRERPQQDAPPPLLFDLAQDPGETTDLASERPQLAAELFALHEDWFADVSSSRPDPWLTPRIHVGGPTAARLVLTRQDWRHERGEPWGHGNGRWRLDVRESGRYRVVIHLLQEAESARIELLHGEEAERVEVGGGAPGRPMTATVELGVGPLDLRVVARDAAGKAFGAYQVQLLRIDVEAPR